MYETVPESLSGTFGTLTNLYACVGGMQCALLGMILPHEPSLYKDDQMWRVIYLGPLIWAAIQIYLIRTFFPEEPVIFSISKANIDDAKSLVSKIYTFNDHDQRDEIISQFIHTTNQQLG